MIIINLGVPKGIFELWADKAQSNYKLYVEHVSNILPGQSGIYYMVLNIANWNGDTNFASIAIPYSPGSNSICFKGQYTNWHELPY